METLLTHLSTTPALTLDACDLCLQLLTLLRLHNTSTSPSSVASSHAKRWKKTRIGLQLVEIAADLDNTCEATLAETLASWKDTPADKPFSGAGNVQGAAEAVNSHYTQLCQRRMAEAEAALETALQAMEGAPCGVAGGTSWREALMEASTWPDVLREAQYRLVGAEKRLTPLVATSEKAWTAYLSLISRAGLEPREDLMERHTTAAAAAKATACEELFVNTLETMPLGQSRRRALQSRIESMSRKAVAPSLIHPQIWERVMSAIKDK